MVTAIAIPIVLAYFYWLTKKEMKANFQEWIKLGEVPEEAIVSGKIIEVNEYKERFYYHRYNHITVLKINTGIKELTVKKVTPLRKGSVPPHFNEGDMVHLYGSWKQGFFSINRTIRKA